MASSMWMYERTRSLSAIVAAVLVVAAASISNLVWSSVSWSDACVVGLLTYMAAYFVFTALAFGRASPADIAAWADREERGTFAQRYLWGTAPGPGVSLFFAAVSLVVAVVWLPGHGGTGIPALPRVLIGVGLIAVAWASVAVSYAVTFHADNLVEGGRALDFPDDSEPQWSDYVYFAVSVMTTFGTTDVTVASKELRKTITANAIIAFVFNTVIVAAAVSSLTSG